MLTAERIFGGQALQTILRTTFSVILLQKNFRTPLSSGMIYDKISLISGGDVVSVPDGTAARNPARRAGRFRGRTDRVSEAIIPTAVPAMYVLHPPT